MCGLQFTFADISEAHDAIGLTATSGVIITIPQRDGTRLDYELDGKTAFIDQSLVAENQIGRLNFTMMHEAAHQLFWMLYPEEYEAQTPRCVFHMTDEHTQYPVLDWEEWQTNVLTSFLLLPKELVYRHMADVGLKDGISVLNRIYARKEDYEHFSEAAKRLGVSKTALAMLLGRDRQGIIPIAKQEPEPQEPKPFALPKPYLTMRRMYAYLTKHRCIDRDVVTAFVQEKLLYEDDPHHNCVFVGLDENGEARHAHLRSTGSQGKVFRINVESSDIKHSFHKNGTDRSLYVFEAPIDLLSHITLYPAGWLEHSYVACCGTSIQPVLERLRQNPKLDTVYLCLDNDEAGEDACDGMLDTLEDMGYDVERLRPEGKDWNDDLRAKRGKISSPTA